MPRNALIAAARGVHEDAGRNAVALTLIGMGSGVLYSVFHLDCARGDIRIE